MTDSVSLTFHGAARTVTGSCMEFSLGARRVLVDCGLFQGSRSLETLNQRPFDFNAREIDAVILTHAHIDHSGLLPRLVKDGFRGDIWCTSETSDLLEFMLADAGRIQETEATRRNRRRDRAGEEPFVPIYTEEDAIKAWRATRAISLEQWFEPVMGFRARLWNAGHILGSTSVELEIDGVRIMCSGDVGPENKAFEKDPSGPTGFDYVICESTYGDRQREALNIAERRILLEAEIRTALARGGNLVIPAFALERTQELLLDIATLSDEGRIPNAPVFVDSPLANRTTSVFARYAHELEDVRDPAIFSHPSIHYVDAIDDSIRLNSMSGAIILAASGMCEAGRIRHHLIHNLHRRDSTVLFVGFQAQGSLGRIILEGAERVRISGEDINVRAQIRRIDSYSAHADQTELLAWIGARRPIAGSLFLTHGEPEAIETLRRLSQSNDFASSIVTPEISETYALVAGKAAKRTRTGSPELQRAIGRDWQNSYADFAANLKKQLARIDDEEARQKAIADMRRILDEYAEFRGRKKEKRERGH